MKKLIYLSFIASALALTSCGGEDPIIDNGPDPTTKESSFLYGGDTTEFVTIEDFGAGVGTMTMQKNKVYVLKGFVFVNEGQTLTIEPGTIVKGKSGQGENASALIVARGGKIMANGTASEPIIFTAEADGTNRNTKGELSGSSSLGLTTTGLWGGLIVLGNSGLNSNPGTTAIEGIPTTETRGLYGGNNDADNSGVLKYISIRHGGTDIGAGNEINGLTLGGVGSGTEIDYVEVVANADDGIEFFGGTAQVKHALVANVGDDSFDYDEGFRGKGQFWVSVNANDRNGEHDGGTDPETGMPYATPKIWNASYIGGKKLTFRDNAGGEYHNSIFESFSDELAIDIEDLPEAQGEDSRTQFSEGRLKIENNVFANSGTIMVAYSSNKNISIAPLSNTTSGSVISASNPVPATALTATAPTDSWYTSADYKGAFGSTNWAQGWTLYYGDK